MKLFNKGQNTIVHAESHIKGSACEPQKVFTVSDELGKKLKKMFPNQLECLEDAIEKFSEEPTVEAVEPVVEEVKVEKHRGRSKKEEVKNDEESEAESLGVTIEELRELKK